MEVITAAKLLFFVIKRNTIKRMTDNPAEMIKERRMNMMSICSILLTYKNNGK